MSLAGTENNINDNNNNAANIIFTIKDTKSYVLVVTLSAKDKQKLSKLHSKRFKRSVFWNEYKTKSENEVNILFVSVCTNEGAASIRFKKIKDITYQKELLIIIM